MSEPWDVTFEYTGGRTAKGEPYEYAIATCDGCGSYIELPDSLAQVLKWVEGHTCGARA